MKDPETHIDRPSVQDAILKIFQRSPEVVITPAAMYMMLDARYARCFKNAEEVAEAMMRLTRQGFLIQELNPSVSCGYRLRKKGE